MRHPVLALALCAASLLPLAPSAAAQAPTHAHVVIPPSRQRELNAYLEQIRKDTERFRDVSVALAEGYIPDPTMLCVTAEMVGQPREMGHMGIHYFHPDLVGIPMPPPVDQRLSGTDAELDWNRPEIIIYEPQPGGGMELVAVEYLVFEKAWREAGNTAPPEFVGVPFFLMVDDPATAHDEAHMLEPHYELHLWVHRENPTGALAEFNPRVTCPPSDSRHAGHAPAIRMAAIAEPVSATSQVTTEELQQILQRNSALVFDVRSAREYALGHIPGARSAAPRAADARSDAPATSETITSILGADRARPVVLYCESPSCTQAARIGEQLVRAGYTNVRRYQLGLSVWRAIGGVAAITGEGVRSLLERDRSLVLLDARTEQEFARGTLPRARNVSLVDVSSAMRDGRLPADDLHTRLVVFGRTGAEARALAEALAQQGFSHVSFYAGSYDSLQRVIPDRP